MSEYIIKVAAVIYVEADSQKEAEDIADVLVLHCVDDFEVTYVGEDD